MHRLAPRLVIVSSFLVSLLFVAASVVVVSLVAGTSSAAPAAAGNGRGAVQTVTNGPIDLHQCADEGSVTFCTIAQGEFHGVCTPTGNCNVQQNLRSLCFTLTDNSTGNTISTYCGSDHYQYHTELGETQVYHSSTSLTYSDTSGVVCTYDAQFHEANGRVQYDHSSYTCTQPPATPIP